MKVGCLYLENNGHAMTIKTKLSAFNIILIFFVSFLPTSVGASGNSILISPFSDSLSIKDTDTNETSILSGLHIDGLKTLQVMQQPVGNNNFVTPQLDVVTEYQTALNYGTIGLLAHNYLAGQYFFQISPGQNIELIYNDKTTVRFVVTQIQQYRALSQNSSASDFIDLDSGKFLTASQLFRKIYKNQTGHLVLQTCIYADQNPTWGRLFIIAEPVE